MTAALRAVEGGEAERARALAHSAVAAFPGPDALFYLGNLRALTGDPEAAARALERSYAQRPRPEVAANLAVIAARRGDEVAADRWDRRAAWLAGRGSDAGGPGPW